MNYIIVGGKVLVEEAGDLVVREKNIFVKDGKICAVEEPSKEACESTDANTKNGGMDANVNHGRTDTQKDVCADDLGMEKQEGRQNLKVADFELVDASDKLILPGLLNMHTHAYMTLMRNYADDVDFNEWLFKRVMPVEDTLPVESAYWSSLLGLMEMVRTGTTTFVDMHMFEGMSAKAARDLGMRAYIGRGLVGEDLYVDGLSRFEQMLREQEKYESDLVKFAIAPHAIYSCSPKLYEQAAKEGEKRGLLLETHVSESDFEVDSTIEKYGKTPVAVLADTGFLTERTLLAHCVKMRGDDISIIKNFGSTVVTNPASNAKLGNGFAPVTEFEEAGVNVAIGTDGVCSNNSLNMFREMGLLSTIHKGVRRDSTKAPAKSVVRMATANAAKPLCRAGLLGTIANGAEADLAFLDLKSPSMIPQNNLIASLCYSANGSEVESVMIGGKWVMQDRRFPGIDEERVRYEVEQLAAEYLKK